MSTPKKRPSKSAGGSKPTGGPKAAGGARSGGARSARSGPSGASGSARGGRPAGAGGRGRTESSPSRSGPSRGRATGGRPSSTRGSSGPPAAARQRDRGLDGTQVEGRHAVRELLLAGTRRTRQVLIAEQMDQADILDDIVELAHDLKVPVREISKRKLDAESRTEASQGVVAHADALPDHGLSELASNRDAFLIAVDGVTDPGNLGAIIRTAECAGVTGMVLPRHRAVHITPTVTKAAAGAVEHVPMALVGGLPTAIDDLRQAGVWVVGLDAAGDRSLHDLELGDRPVCLVLGAEGSGLSRLVRQRCDEIVSIPLRGSLSSLNVSTAAAVAIYEVVRHRSEGS